MKKTKGKNPPPHQERETRNQKPFVHGGNVYAFARTLGVTPDELLDFSASINLLGMPSCARQAYRAALRQVEHYPEPYAQSLIRALADLSEDCV